MDGVSALAKEEDYVGQFISDCLENHDKSDKVRLSCTAMYDAFKWWWSVNMDTREQRIPSMKSINQALRERGLIVEKSGGKTWIENTTISFDIVLDIQEYLKKGDKS
jgi:hypothetical protein